jgi:SAM-dependent methyltransferase
MHFDRFFFPIRLRRDLHDRYRLLFNRYLPADAVVYDVGCGQKPFKAYLAGKVRAHIGVDLADGFYKPDEVDLVGTAYAVPAADGVADVVLLSEVLEHLETPLVAMREAHRLLKPGGLVLMSFPFMYPVHAPPRDFMRYTEYFVADQVAAIGFEVVETGRLGGYWYLMGMYGPMYLKTLDRGPLRAIGIIKVISSLICMACAVMHRAEAVLARATGKNPQQLRSIWTANMQVVLRKRAPGATT